MAFITMTPKGARFGRRMLLQSASLGTVDNQYINREEGRMNTGRSITLQCAMVLAASLAMAGETLPDEAVKREIVRFVTLPGSLCGKAIIDFRNELRERKLTNRAWFDGDTNRLARLIADLAQTNDVELSSMMINALGEYGTAAQLPFLYSCATNPVVGHGAVKAVMRIEGVTSNSLLVAQSYVSLTNGFPLMKTDDRSDLCRSIVTTVFENEGLSSYRPFVMDIACGFAENVNVIPMGLDKTLVAVDPDFRFTKRRLAILRAAQARLNERFQVADTNSAHFSAESRIHDVQTNYLTSAIYELVAYPEADLPD